MRIPESVTSIEIPKNAELETLADSSKIMGIGLCGRDESMTKLNIKSKRRNGRLTEA